ncbi:MAG: hypothetical protein K0R34_2913 [Herbinix sp.]|jgi:hypothetical protein|nr:hypothetical protein [Herbinix sp.]
MKCINKEGDVHNERVDRKRVSSMKIKSKIIRRIMIDIISLIVISLFLVLWQTTVTAGQEDQLQKALLDTERLVYYALEDNTAYLLVSTTDQMAYGDLLLVLNRGEGGVWKRSYENEFTGLKPWKLVLADVDGDGEQEILTAVRKTTFYDKEEKNRLFIFNYINGKLVKKWTGSDIAGSWEDFVSGELVDTKGEEIIFITKTKEGSEKLFVYHWFDFGFLMLAQSGDYEDIIEVGILKENRINITYIDGQKKRELLQLVGGRVSKVN